MSIHCHPSHTSISALNMLGRPILPAVQEDQAARDSMMLASMFAGIAFGDVGVHLPHAMSYAVSGGVREFKAKDYNLSEGASVLLGMSVILNAPPRCLRCQRFHNFKRTRRLMSPSLSSRHLYHVVASVRVDRASRQWLMSCVTPLVSRSARCTSGVTSALRRSLTKPSQAIKLWSMPWSRSAT